MTITLQDIAKAIEDYDQNTNAVEPSFGKATKINNTQIKAEIVWGGYLEIQHPDFRYAINFGEADKGWSYNDDEGFGYGDFISEKDFTTSERIAKEFFLQVFNNPQLIK